MEGRLEIELPGTLLEARPVNPKSLIVLRIAEVRPRGNASVYDLRYLGLVPGKYDLRDYLLRKDGSTTADLPMLAVQIGGLLPEKHQGELVEPVLRKFPFLGGYKTLIAVVTIAWVLCLIPWWMTRRKQPKIQTPTAAPRAQTMAERLQPLVALAAEGKLSGDQMAQLERLLLSHWRERLGLNGVSMAESVQRVRNDPEGGVLLRELENWLHRPPGAVKVDVAALLAPYRGSAVAPMKVSEVSSA